MLYLFNSCYRPLYAANVLKTLALPYGCVNDYRYTHTGHSVNIKKTLISDLENHIDEQVGVFYIDRFADNQYKYFPLRLGKLLSAEEDGGRIFLQICLDAFIFPKSIENFNAIILDRLVPQGLAKLTNGDPDNKNDGLYALLDQCYFEFNNSEEYFLENEAWDHITDTLMSTKKFGSSNDNDYVFLKTEIQDQHSEPIIPEIEFGESVFEVNRKTNYHLKVRYKYPLQLQNPERENKFQIFFTSPFLDKGPLNFHLDSFENHKEFTFQSVTYPDTSYGYISYSFPNDLKDPDLRLKFRIKDESSRWFLIAIVIIFLGISIVFSQIESIFNGNIWQLLDKYRIKIIANIIQVFLLLFLFKLLGRKIT